MEKKFNPIERLSPEEEIKLVRSGDMDLFRQYIEQHLLSHVAQMEMFATGNLGMLLEYVKVWPFCPNAEVAMLELGNKDLLREYSFSLHPDAQLKLLELGDWDLVKRYLNKFYFTSAVAESKFLQCGDYDLLKWYMEKNYLHPNSEVKLVKLGNVQLIKDYIQICPLSKAARLELTNLKGSNLAEFHRNMWHV